MRSTVLYRKWRPEDFDSVAGQDPVVRTLQNAVAQDKISHAYLFCGPRGTGKTTTARILARAINGIAPSTAALAGGDGMGFDLIEVDAASNRGIADIRELRERANYQPGSARFKVYLIDEVHQLTDAAADALLKTLEEPPPHVVFILATTDPESLKPTILSRCQRFDFRRVAVDDIVGRLRTIADAEAIAISDEALRLIAREATGSLRDAVNLLDQLWTTCGSEVSLDAAQEALGLSPDVRAFDFVEAALQKDLSAGLAIIGAVQSDAVDFLRFKKQIVIHLRHVLLLLTGADSSLSLSEPEEERLRAVSKGVDPSAAVAALRIFAETHAEIRADPYNPLPLELALAEIIYPAAPASAAAPVRQQVQTGRQQQTQQLRRETRAAKPPPVDHAAQPTQSAPPRPTVQPAVAPRTAREAPARGADPLTAIRDELKRRGSVRLSAMLNGSCRIVEQSEAKLSLGFLPNFHNIHLLEARNGLKQITEAASVVLGRQMAVDCIPVDDSATPASPVTPPISAPIGAQTSAPAASPTVVAEEQAPPSYSSLVEDARRHFDASVIKS